MAKRRAEALALALGALGPRFFPHAPRPKRSRSDLELPCAALRRGEGGCCPKRKREAMERGGREEGGGGGGGGGREEEAAGQSKRRAAEEEEAVGGPPGNEEEALLEEGPAGRRRAPRKEEEQEKELRASPARDLPPQNEDDVWRYNSFQYWRSPLPTINLSDILDLESKNAVAERDSNSIGLSEMET